MPQGCFYFLLAAIEDRSRRGLNSACDIRDDKLATLNVPDVSDPKVMGERDGITDGSAHWSRYSEPNRFLNHNRHKALTDPSYPALTGA